MCIRDSKVTSAEVKDGFWDVSLESSLTGETSKVTARMVVTAAGPWVGDVVRGTLKSNQQGDVRLVRGSHIVTKQLFNHDKCYFFQGVDGRITFAIPYETDYTLIGTTDAEHPDASVKPECTPEEQAYLLNFINQYLAKPIGDEEVVWTYSGVRPLYDDGASSASAATRDYVLKMDMSRGAPALNIFGGKITTYRRLAESALDEIADQFKKLPPKWTAGVSLPGGDFPVDGVQDLIANLRIDFPFLNERWATRLVRAYGTEATDVLRDAKTKDELGMDFGADLTENEVEWLMDKEYARRADDVVWRRSKIGLRLTESQIATLDNWMKDRLSKVIFTAAE